MGRWAMWRASMEGLGSSGGTCSRASRRAGHQGDRQKDDGMHLPLLSLPPHPLPPPQVPSTHGPSDRAPEGSGSTTQEQSWSRRRVTVE